MPTTSEVLAEKNLISGPKIKVIFDEIFSDILKLDINSPSQMMHDLWARFPSSETPSLNGSVFEGLLATILYRHNVRPLYVQANLAFVPNVEFDFVAYSKKYGPIILSAKTSLRERYKQADLEGMMVRQVHRKARSYLITLNEPEARNVNKKIEKGQVLGIDKVILATNVEFDHLVKSLVEMEFYSPLKIDVLTSKRLIT